MALTQIRGPQRTPRQKTPSEIFQEELARGTARQLPQLAGQLLGGVIEKSLAPTGPIGRGLMTEEALRNMELNALAGREKVRAETQKAREEMPTKRYKAAQAVRREEVKGRAALAGEEIKGEAKLGKAMIDAYGKIYSGAKGLNSKDRKVRRTAMKFFYNVSDETASAASGAGKTKEVANAEKKLKGAAKVLESLLKHRKQLEVAGTENPDLFAKLDKRIATQLSEIKVYQETIKKGLAASLRGQGDIAAADELANAQAIEAPAPGTERPSAELMLDVGKAQQKAVVDAEDIRLEYAKLASSMDDAKRAGDIKLQIALAKEASALQDRHSKLGVEIEKFAKVEPYTGKPVWDVDPDALSALRDSFSDTGRGLRALLGQPPAEPPAGEGPAARVRAAAPPTPQALPAPPGREPGGELAPAPVPEPAPVPVPAPEQEPDGQRLPPGATQIPTRRGGARAEKITFYVTNPKSGKTTLVAMTPTAIQGHIKTWTAVKSDPLRLEEGTPLNKIWEQIRPELLDKYIADLSKALAAR